MNDNQLIKRFENLRELVHSSTDINPFEKKGEKSIRVKSLLDNYEAFCMYYFPHYCSAKFGWFHKKAARYLKNNWNIIFLAQWSREFGKSVHFNILFPLWRLQRKELTGMMVGAANEKLAARLLSDLQAELQANRRLINDFGSQKMLGNWEDGQFVTKSGVSFIGFGKKQSPRGTRFRHQRPNYGTIDDFNTRESVRNDNLSGNDYNWVKEDFMPALSTKKWQLVIPQNKFHRNTVTNFFEQDTEVSKKVKVSRVNMLNELGESNWPEHFTTQEAIDKLESVGETSALREYSNTPVELGKIFKGEPIWTKRLPFKQYLCVSYTDPSYKNSDKSDYKANVFVGKKGSKFIVLKAFVDKVSINTMFGWNYHLDEWVEDNALIKHWMESNFIQGMHFKALGPLAKKKGRRLRILGDDRKKPDKFQRISSLQALWESGAIEFNAAEKQNPHMQRLITQLKAFQRGSGINDDGPDALEGAIYKLEEMAVSTNKPSYVKSKRKSKYDW